LLACRKNPLHPGEYICTEVPNPVTPKGVSSLPVPPVDTPSQISETKGSRAPDSDGIEVWSRSDGKTISVRRIEHEGRVAFEPVEALPQPLPEDPPSPSLKTERQDPSVGRTRASRFGDGGKGCNLSRTHRMQSDMTREEGP
jgi:hypothetical protein